MSDTDLAQIVRNLMLQEPLATAGYLVVDAGPAWTAVVGRRGVVAIVEIRVTAELG